MFVGSDLNAELAFSHPRVGVVSDRANSPADFCSEQPAAAGPVGAHEVGGGQWSIKPTDNKSVIPVKQCDGFHAGEELLEQVALVR